MNDLIIQLILWQVALPLAAMVLNAMVPAASFTGLFLRSAAIFLFICYAGIVGIWLFPPWWTPYLLAGLHLSLSVRLMRRRRRRSSTGMPWKFAETGLSLAAVLAALVLLLPALQGRSSPDVAIDLAIPLGPGRYLVVSGGTTSAINAHFLTLDRESTVAFRGQSYGVDIIGIDALGMRARGISPKDPAEYVIYGRDVLAPCAGDVLMTVDGVADNEVPVMNRDSMTGNSVILDCDGLAVVLAHFIPGSIKVSEGDRVSVGQQIASVGNSGNSGEPHLHIHAQGIAAPDAPIAGRPLWFTINGDLPFRNLRLLVKN